MSVKVEKSRLKHSDQEKEDELMPGREVRKPRLFLPEASLERGILGHVSEIGEKGESVAVNTSYFFAHQLHEYLQLKGINSELRGNIVVAKKDAVNYVRERVLPPEAIREVLKVPENQALFVYNIVVDAYEKNISTLKTSLTVNDVPSFSALVHANRILSELGRKLAVDLPFEIPPWRFGFAAPEEEGVIRLSFDANKYAEMFRNASREVNRVVYKTTSSER